MRMPPPGPLIRMVCIHNWGECMEGNEMTGLLIVQGYRAISPMAFDCIIISSRETF